MGNNALSFSARKNAGSPCRLYIPSLVTGSVDDVRLGTNIAFEVYTNKKLYSYVWLQHLVHIQNVQKDIYVIDNHNHALYCWQQTVASLPHKKTLLVHIDQHSDMATPAISFSNFVALTGTEDIARYTNEFVQVGDFIRPALGMGIVHEVIQIRTESGLFSFFDTHKKILSDQYQIILDIDVDFRDARMWIVQTQKTFDCVRTLITQPNVVCVTIATSPYFMEQHAAIRIVQKLLST